MFNLNGKVCIAGTKSKGIIIGLATYVESSPSYLVRFVNGNGNLTEDWFKESCLSRISDTEFQSDLRNV